MNKRFLFLATMVAMLVGFSACKQENPKDKNKDKDGENTELTPEQTKEKLMTIASSITDKFNTNDQKAAIQEFDDLYGKYQNYSFDDFEDHYAHRYDELFRLPQRAKAVMQGKERASEDRAYTFSFEGESAIWEADDQNRRWVYKGKAADNSVILRAKDKNGVMCEAKVWGEGETHAYSYTWEEYHWEYPIVYLNSSNLYGGTAYGYYDGEYRYFYYEQGTGWYYYSGSRTRTVSFSQIYGQLDWFDVYDYNYNYYSQYDPTTYRFYRNDYENGYRVNDGKRTANGELPAKIIFSFKQASDELIRVELTQDLKKNDHAYFTMDANIINLRWTSDFKINSTNASVAFGFYYGTESLFSAVVNLPSYQLIDKQDSQSYEDWIDQYAERYDELLRHIGSADGLLDINGQAQAKVYIDNAGYVYRDFMRLDEQGVRIDTESGARQYCDIINGGQSNGIYFNSDIKQADVRMQIYSEERWRYFWDESIGDYREEQYTAYDIEPVLYFPSDGTTYAFEQYFNRKPFTNLQYTIEDLANAYIRLSYYLYNEVGTISF